MGSGNDYETMHARTHFSVGNIEKLREPCAFADKAKRFFPRMSDLCGAQPLAPINYDFDVII